MTKSVISVDLGASSGRVFVVAVEGEHLRLEPVSRFVNGGIWLQGHLLWNVLSLYGSVVEGLAVAQRIESERGVQSVSVGIDSWAVDYGLIDREGRLKGFPFHHRDPRTIDVAAATLQRVGEWELYCRNGVTAHSFNTIFQLQEDLAQHRIADGDRALLVPDLLAYFLTNEMTWETTNASTTQLMGLSGTWDDEVFSEAMLPRSLVGDPSLAGERIGEVCAPEALNLGVAASMLVTSVASHDTASAVLAVPASTERFAYISSGTWSLIGLELAGPVISREGMRAGFTNERGIDGTVRYLRNVMGFWLLQQVLAESALGSTPLEVSELSQASESVPQFSYAVDAEDPLLLGQGDMRGRLARLSRETCGRTPERLEEFARCIFDSLALAYRRNLHLLRTLTDRGIDVVHIVGGGANNDLLCQLTADACELPVLAGPVEAAALGNGLVQLRSLGLGPQDRWEMRNLVRHSMSLREYLPTPGCEAAWQEAEVLIEARRRLER